MTEENIVPLWEALADAAISTTTAAVIALEDDNEKLKNICLDVAESITNQLFVLAVEAYRLGVKLDTERLHTETLALKDRLGLHG